MNNAIRLICLCAICLGIFGFASWSVYSGMTQKTEALVHGCEGQPIGAVRIDNNGSPQICLKR